MVSLKRRLPPLTALTAFEAVARLMSFTKAAEELGVTQAAVSRQIHLLERELGMQLFVRLHRRIELTRQGVTLANAASDAFLSIATTISDLSRQSQNDDLTICATVAFSHFWLIPRISEFSRQYPAISIRIVSRDDIPDMQSGDYDLAIRFGGGLWAGGRAEFLFDDEIFPICSAEFALTAGPIQTPEDLLTHPLISNEADDPSWIGWEEWFAAFSVPMPKRTPGFRCSFYTEAIYAALNGQGIALGWKRLVSDLLNQNSLTRLTDQAVSTRNAYFAIIPTAEKKRAATDAFVEWLKVWASTSVGK